MPNEPAVPVNPQPAQLPPKFDVANVPAVNANEAFSGLKGKVLQWASSSIIAFQCCLLGWMVYRQDANSGIIQDIIEANAAERREEASKSREHGDKAVAAITTIMIEQQRGRDVNRIERAKDTAEIKDYLKRVTEMMQGFIQRALEAYLAKKVPA